MNMSNTFSALWSEENYGTQHFSPSQNSVGCRIDVRIDDSTEDNV